MPTWLGFKSDGQQARFNLLSSGLRLPVLTSFSPTYLPRLTLDCQLKQSAIHSIDSIKLLILKSLALIQKHFFEFFLSLSLPLFMLSPTLLSAFHLFSYFFIALILSTFFFLFHLSSILTNAKCKCHAPSHANECHDRSYQCNMQPLCPNMSLINFESLT